MTYIKIDGKDVWVPDVYKVRKGPGKSLSTAKAMQYVHDRVKERGIIEKRYSIAYVSLKHLWKALDSLRIPKSISIVEFHEVGSGTKVIFIGRKVDIQTIIEKLAKKKIVRKGSALRVVLRGKWGDYYQSEWER